LARKIEFAGFEDMPPLAVSLEDTLINPTGSWKYFRPIHRERMAPCREACPAGGDIQAFVQLILQGKWDEAWKTVIEDNPFPATTGRVCYHPCERGCNRGLFDEPVAIRALERAVGDHGLRLGAVALDRAELKKQRVAVIGSGPAGLSSAYHLARLGYGVTVFERASKPGGLLRLGIPEYRLPRAILDGEIARVQALGVEIKTNALISGESSWRELQHFDAVFLATGAHQSRKLGIPGEELGGVFSGLQFLRAVNEGRKVGIGRRVLVLGGGNTAMDAARCALRLGSQVTVLYRRTRQEMPAIDEEVEDALREGVEIRFLVAPVRIHGREGKVAQLECIRMQLGEPDETGRRRPIPLEGSNFLLDADTILSAVGEAIDTDALPAGVQIRQQSVLADRLGATSLPRFFAGGDLIDQPRTVVHAIGAGKRAAMAIDLYLSGQPLDSLWDQVKIGHKGSFSMGRYLGRGRPDVAWKDNENIVPFERINPEYFIREARIESPEQDVDDRVASFVEVYETLPPVAAMEEAARCFSCGTCTQCDNCWVFCPDVAVRRRGDTYEIDYDYCKGCGVCATECPRGVITLVREGEV